MLPTKLPSTLRTMPFSAPQQDRTTLSPLLYFRLALSLCGLGSDLVGIHSSSWAARFRVAKRAHPLSAEVWRMSVRNAGTIALLSLLYLPLGNMSFPFHPWLSTQRMQLLLFVGWIVMTHLVMCRKTDNRKLSLGYFRRNSINKILLGLCSSASKVLGPIRSSSCCRHPAPHETCIARFSPWVARWLSSHPLEWFLYCTKTSH